MKLNQLMIIVLAFVIASCGQAIDNPDWCYVLDFTSDDFDSTVTSGSYIGGAGFRNTGGTLSVTYNHTALVEPAQAIITIQVVASGSNTFSASYNVFGIDGTYTDTIPAYITSLEIPLNADAGDASSDATVTITSADTITLSRLEIRGFGYNSFGSNSCEPDATPTNTQPAIPSATASNTPTATMTYTPSPTLTPTITNTPGGWCYMADMTGASMPTNFVIGVPGPDPAGTHVPGSGVRTALISVSGTTYYRIIWVFYTGTTNFSFTKIDAEFNIVSYGVNVGAGSYLAYNGYRHPSNFVSMNLATYQALGTGTHTISSGAASVTNNDGFYIRLDDGLTTIAAGDPGGEVYLRRITVYGSSTNPFGVDNCTYPTPTPGSTDTPAPTSTGTITPTDTPIPATGTPAPATSTPTYEEQCFFTNYSMNGSLTGWTTGGTARYSNGSVLLNDGDTISQTLTLEAGTYYISARVNAPKFPKDSNPVMSLFYEWDFESPPPYSGFLSFNLDTLLETQNDLWLIDSIAVTAGSRTVTFLADLPSTIEYIRIYEFCLSFVSPDDITSDNGSGGGGWSQCSDIISAPLDWLDIGGWILYLWNSLWQWLQCVLLQILLGIISLIVNMAIFFYNVFQWIMGFLANIWNWTIGFFQWLFSAIRNFMFVLLVNGLLRGADAYIAISGTIEQLVGFINAAVNFINGWVSIANIFLQLISFRIQLLINTWLYAPPEPIPGMPNCAINPTEQDVCAVYYVAEYTFLTGIGSLLITGVVVIIDIVSILLIIEVAKRIVAGLQDTIKR